MSGVFGSADRGRARAPRLVGREAEIAVLARRLGEAADGHGGVALATGEAGIGKSRLIEAAAEEATARGMVVLTGRAVEATMPVAYRPFAEALCSLVRAGEAPSRESLAPFDVMLAPLIPDWRSARGSAVEQSVVTLAEAVLRFLCQAAGNAGCLVVLEDLHWADPETVAILEYLAENLGSERVLCAASWRVDERGQAPPGLRTLDSRRAAETIRLDRLDDRAVADMVGSCLDLPVVPDDVLALASRAEGVPFLVEEILAAASASGALVVQGQRWSVAGVEAVVPPSYLESVHRRLAALGRDARAVLVAGAVLGRRFEWNVLPAIAMLDEAATLAGLRAGVDHGLVEVDADPSLFRFRHALSRDAVLADLLPPERTAIAGRAVAAIESAHPALEGEWCERAAALALEADDHDRAPALLLDAARRAMGVGALASAESALEHALQVARGDAPIVADLEECLVQVLASVGKRDRAVEIGESLLVRLGLGPGTAVRRTAVELLLARASVAATRWDEAAARVDAARRDAATAVDESLLAQADALEAVTALGLDQPDRAAALAQAALAAATRLELPEVSCEALEVIGRCARVSDLAVAEDAFTRAHALAEREGLAVWQLRALHELGTIDMLRSGDLGRLEGARALATSSGALATGAVIDIQLCGVLVGRDDPEPAITVARRSADVARRLDLGQTLAVALGFEANGHARAGRRDLMEQCLAEAYLHAGGDASIDVFAACARTNLALLDDDRDAALEHLDVDIAHDARFFSPLIGWWVLLRALEVEHGDNAVAAVRDAGEPAHYLARPYFLYAEAVVLGRHGHAQGAMARVAEADALLDGFEWYRQTGRRYVAEAALADGWGQPEAWAREALAFFESWGQDHLAAACRGLLRRAGAPVPRRGRGSAKVPTELRALGVTSREVDVLALVAAGLSNREVAERLVLSVRTVENHVERLLAKTGAARRAALADIAARAGVPPLT